MSDRQHNEAIRQLEDEHAGLSAQIEGFAALLFDLAHRAEAADRLRELLIAIGMHFGFEESLMDEGGYALFDHHRRQHLGIMTELGLLLDRVESAEDPLAIARSVDLLGQWYREHVAHSDSALLDWLGSTP